MATASLGSPLHGWRLAIIVTGEWRNRPLGSGSSGSQGEQREPREPPPDPNEG